MLGGIHHNLQQWCNYLWAARQSSLDYVWLHLCRKEGFPVKSVISFSGIFDVTQTCWQAAVIYLLYGGLTVFMCEQERQRFFSTNWPLGCLLIYFWITFLSLDKPSGAAESSCLPEPPSLSFLFTLVLVPHVWQPLLKSSLLKLLTHFWGINTQMMCCLLLLQLTWAYQSSTD